MAKVKKEAPKDVLKEEQKEIPEDVLKEEQKEAPEDILKEEQKESPKEVIKKVIIIMGAYGHKPSNAGFITVKTKADGPFDLSEDEAARLVALGVAEYYEAKLADANVAGVGVGNKNDDDEEAEIYDEKDGDDNEADNEDVANEGIEKAEGDDEHEDSEAPPDLTASDPVGI